MSCFDYFNCRQKLTSTWSPPWWNLPFAVYCRYVQIVLILGWYRHVELWVYGVRQSLEIWEESALFLHLAASLPSLSQPHRQGSLNWLIWILDHSLILNFGSAARALKWFKILRITEHKPLMQQYCTAIQRNCYLESISMYLPYRQSHCETQRLYLWNSTPSNCLWTLKQSSQAVSVNKAYAYWGGLHYPRALLLLNPAAFLSLRLELKYKSLQLASVIALTTQQIW